MNAVPWFLGVWLALAAPQSAFAGSVGVAGFEVSLRTETDDPELSVSRDGGALVVDNTKASLQRRYTFHRLAASKDGRVIFGYDIEVGRGAGAGEFSVVLRPLDQTYEQRVRAEPWFPRDSSLGVNGRIVSFEKSRTLATVALGEKVEIELYRNSATGRRIWDVLTLAEHPLGRPWSPVLRRTSPDQLHFSRLRVLVNGRDETPASSELSVTGVAVMIALHPHGRFYFSRVPMEGYPRDGVARVEGKRLTFTGWRGYVYEFVSEVDLLPGGEALTLWGYAEPARADDSFAVSSASDIKRLLPAKR